MQYNFDEVIDRHNTNSVKWDFTEECLGEKDVLPLTVADMDFKAPAPVIDAVVKAAQHGVYGYCMMKDSYYNSVVKWIRKRHDWDIKKDWIVFSPRVGVALSLLVQNLTEKDDKIIIQPPVYAPLRGAVESNNREVVTNPLKFENGQYKMNFEDLENKIDEKVKMLILCSPHNPVGRVWTKDELQMLGRICFKHNILIIVDEIHSDIIYDGYKHIPFGSISDELANSSVVCTSVSKTFNLAGLHAANIIIPNSTIRNVFKNALDKTGIHNPNIFGVTALQAAYEYGEQWYLQMMKYIYNNLKFLTDYINDKIPQIKVINPEGTYLVWIDCRELGLSSKQLKDILIKKGKVGVYEGSEFGDEGAGFIRINIACPRVTLNEALKRIEKVINHREEQKNAII